MNVVDSSAWMAWFAGDQNSGNFSNPITDVDSLLIPSITLTEVFKSMLRQKGQHSALRAITQMKLGAVVPLDSILALDAAAYGIQYKLPLADSIIYATARRFDSVLWTQDADFKDLPNVKFFSYRE